MTAAGATIGKSTTYQSDGPACYAGFLARFRPSARCDGRFIAYWMQSADYWAQIETGAVRSTIDNFSAGKYRGIKAPQPSLGEQRRIVDFLDERVSRIDNIISARAQQLSALRQRLGSISSEMTFSAYSDDSGTRLKSLYDVIDERAGARELQLLSVSIHLGVVPRSTITDDVARADDLSTYKVSEPGDIVLNRMRAFQGAIGINRTLGIVSPDYLVLRPHPNVRADWLHFVFRSDWFVGEMIARLRGIGSVELGSVRTPRINASDLGEIRLKLPEVSDQKRTVDRLVNAQRSTEHVIAGLDNSITLLAEYKQSLITAAVTGELDVTTASKKVPA